MHSSGGAAAEAATIITTPSPPVASPTPARLPIHPHMYIYRYDIRVHRRRYIIYNNNNNNVYYARALASSTESYTCIYTRVYIFRSSPRCLYICTPDSPPRV